MIFHFSDEEKKSLLITSIFSVVLLLLLVYIRFATTAPPDHLAGGGGGGVEINFGDSDWGSGSDFTSDVLNVTETSKSAVMPVPVSEEDILAQENTTDTREYTVIKKQDEKLKEKKVTAAIPNTTVKSKVSNATNDALSSLLGGNNKGGDGNSNRAANQGRRDGSLSSGNYSGDGGSGGGSGGGHGTGAGTGIGGGTGSGTGGGTGYHLTGRKAISKPIPVNSCNQDGRVVVEVTVNRNGKVIKATPGIKGTTNNSRCLLDAAQKAALNTRWEAKSSASENQVGSIVYNFRLGGN